MAGIFISYRRKESKPHARLLFERLAPLFAGRVFMDVDGLMPGENFRDKIERQLEGCTVLLALIGPQWAQVCDDAGRRRLQDARDWVRLEIATALLRGIVVIPVLIEGALMPPEAELPLVLHPMLDRHAFTLDLDQGFDSGMGTLLAAIRPHVPEEPAKPIKPKLRWWVNYMAFILPVVMFGVVNWYWGLTPKRVEPVAAMAVPAIASTSAVPASVPDFSPPGKRYRDCEQDACPWMVVIPTGSFLMGSPDNEPERSVDEGPQHRVSIAKFSMGQFEVTQGQWKALMGNNPSRFSQCGDTCPVENVSWEMAQAYVKKLSAKTGQSYRLPSEAEWEYAARAGTVTPFHTGQTITTGQANFDGRYTYNGGAKGEYREKTMPVGSFKANGFGLSDLHGNVWEWVDDCWHDTYENAPVSGESWDENCRNSRYVLRGGSWSIDPKGLRSAIRNGDTPSVRYDDTGFRIAKTSSH